MVVVTFASSSRPAAGQCRPEPAQAVKAPDPPRSHYPPGAKRAHIEGRVVADLSVSRAGRVTDVELVEPAGHGFDEVATRTFRRWRFEPARDADCEPVSSTFRATQRFSLAQFDAPYSIEVEDTTDRRFVWSAMFGTAMIGRELTLGAALNADLRLLHWLRVDLGGVLPYVSTVSDVIVAEVAVAIGSNREQVASATVTLDTEPARLEVVGAETFTVLEARRLEKVPLLTRRQFSFRAGSRLYRGLISQQDGTTDQLVGDLWQLTGGVQWRDMRTFAISIPGYINHRGSRVFTTTVDALYAVDRTEFDGTTWDRLGFRAGARMGSHRPAGFGLDFQLGYNGAGVGWFVLFGLGLGGAL